MADQKEIQKVCVFGGGSFGTALAFILAKVRMRVSPSGVTLGCLTVIEIDLVCFHELSGVDQFLFNL